MSRNYKFADPEGLYFVSFATIHWIDVFVRRLYFDCLVENLNHCVDEKGMEIFAWCIMPSHMHLVFRSLKEKPEDLLGGFKSVTARKLIKLIEENRRKVAVSGYSMLLKRPVRPTPITPGIIPIAIGIGSNIIIQLNCGACR